MRVLAAVVVTLLACGDNDTPVPSDAALEGTVTVHFDVPASGPPAWGSAPFPSDFHLGDDGHVALGALPSDQPIWDLAVRAELAHRRGVCAVCPVYLPVDGDIDRATLQATDAVVLVDAATDTRLPVEVEWQSAERVIAVRPQRGIVLTRNGHYVVAITTAVHGADGLPLRAAPRFAAARDGHAATAAELRVAAAVEAGLGAAERAGIARAHIVGAVPITVDDTPGHVVEIRDLVASFYASTGGPVPTVDRVYRVSDGTLDDLMGIPSEDRPGFDVPPADGTPDQIAVAHGTTAIVIAGRFRSPRIVEGVGTEVGRLRRASGGGLMAGPAEEVRYVLAIPSGVDVTALPVVVMHSGLTATLDSTLYMADTAGRAGAALLALEPFQHGSRAPSGSDIRHGMRGLGTTLGPDGFFEHDNANVNLAFNAVPGAQGGISADPSVVFGTLSQMTSDLLALFTLVRSGDLAAIAAADPSLAGLAFDHQRVSFFGLSVGTIIGASALVTIDDTSAVVLSGAIGGSLDVVTEAPAARQIWLEVFARLLALPALTWEPERRLASHVLHGLWQWVMCPVTPTALAPHFFHSPLGTGPRPDLLVQLGALDEGHGTLTGDTVVAALGVPAVSTPTTANLTVGAGTVTAGAWTYPIADNYVTLFKGTRSTMLPPIAPPYQLRAEPLVYDNPIVEAHDQIVQFWRTRMQSGRAEITGTPP